jgi:hypothetical protein
MLRSPQAVECRLMPRSITGVVSALPPTLPPNYPGVGGNAWHDPGRASQKVLTNQYSPALLGTAWDPCHALQNRLPRFNSGRGLQQNQILSYKWE